jgi:hypothetical protein
MNHMETRRLRRQLTSCLIHSALAFALVLAPGSGWAGASKGNPMATLNDAAASRAERIKAAKALADSKDPQAIDTLVKQLAIRDEGIVTAVKSALRALNAVPVLEQRLADSGASEEHKVLACTGLRALKEKSSIPPLVSALKDHGARVRKEAALALGVIAPAEAETALLTALSDSDRRRALLRGRRARQRPHRRGGAGHRDAPGSGDQPGRPFRAAGRQEQAGSGRLAVDSCAPDRCYSLIPLMPLSGSYPRPPQRLSSAERISPVRSRVTKPPWGWLLRTATNSVR